jgi:pyruvate/2-oxoglutarate/acetoin dehydrogenase E1 component
MFWESLNAIGVLKSPSIITIYDDGYAISVPNEYAMVKQDISKLLLGFQRRPEANDGFEIFVVHGWDYPNLVKVFRKAEEITRKGNIPSIIHVIEMTQPQGHSTSGSHERYKPRDRLDWEIEHDCISRFRAWILSKNIATPEELDQIELDCREDAEDARKKAWEAYTSKLTLERNSVANILIQLEKHSSRKNEINDIKDNLLSKPSPLRRHTMSAILDALIVTREENHPEKEKLIALKKKLKTENEVRYGSNLYSQFDDSALHVPEIEPAYQPDAPTVNGYEVLNACFEAALTRDPRIIAFGQDVGRLGGVNQAFRGLQDKFGELRVTDTGVRELTIIGQAIGLAMRGLRPIAEIQYLDYLIYALQIMSDDLATLRWRTAGGQKAPVIIRTRGHRLEGIWHSGSQLSGIINLVRGMYVIVPRNMTQAAGFYNTLLAAEEPGLIIEVLNGYRAKEKLPTNIGSFTIPLGIPEIVRHGSDTTAVTYGATCQVVLNAAEKLQKVGIDIEVIDARTLLPFDINASILESLKKTGRIVFIDEDVPGGATAYMLQEVIERQGGYYWLDSEPRTLSGRAHRPAFGSDGDYWSKPNPEQIFETIYEIMHEVNPNKYPNLFSY